MSTGVRSRSFCEIAVAQYERQALPPVLGVAQWVARPRDFHDNRIGSPVSEMSNRPCIGPLSKRVVELWCL